MNKKEDDQESIKMSDFKTIKDKVDKFELFI